MPDRRIGEGAGVELDRRIELVIEHQERCDAGHPARFPSQK
jgi:hypothetical protein